MDIVFIVEPSKNLEVSLMRRSSIVLDAAAVLGLLAGWATIALSWSSLPDRTPLHFGMTGEPDAWGGRSGIMIGPAVMTAVVVFLTLAMRARPEFFNYPVTIRPDNAERQHRLALLLLRWERAAIAWVTAGLTLQTCRVALGEAQDLGPWALPVTLGLILGPIPVYWVHARRREDR